MFKKHTEPDKHHGTIDMPRILKCIVIGDSNVGKTSLVHRLCSSDDIREYTPTIGVEYNTFIIKPDTKLCFWDTAGQERFRSIVKTFFRNMDIAIVVFDVSKPATFNNMQLWIDIVKEYEDNTTIVIIGNKSDLPDKQIYAEMVKEKYNYPYLEFSTKKFDQTALCTFLESVIKSLKIIPKKQRLTEDFQIQEVKQQSIFSRRCFF